MTRRVEVHIHMGGTVAVIDDEVSTEKFDEAVENLHQIAQELDLSFRFELKEYVVGPRSESVAGGALIIKENDAGS